MNNKVARSGSSVFPDGILVSMSSDKSVAIIDFLSRKSIAKTNKTNDEVTESVFSVALTKQHLQILRKVLEEMENHAS